MLAKQLYKAGRPETAVKQFAKHGTPNVPGNYEFYEILAKEIIQNNPSSDTLISVKDMLYHLQPLSHNLENYLFISHLKSLKEKIKNNTELNVLLAKQSIALLRYTNDIRPDVAFFEAGQAAKVFFIFYKIECRNA